MMRIRIFKKILLTAVLAVFLVSTVGAAFPVTGKWFTVKADLAEASVPLAIGSLGTGTLNKSAAHTLALDEEEQILELLELSAQMEFGEAEEEFKSYASGARTKAFEENYFGYNAHRVTYRLTYTGDDALNAYIRFIPRSDYANGIYANETKEDVFGLQTLECAQNGELQRLSQAGQGSAYYYPFEIEGNADITLAYTVFLSDDDYTAVDFGKVFEIELIQADNNASVLNWNVVIEDGIVCAYNDKYAEEDAYYPYDIDFEIPEDNPNADEGELAPVESEEKESAEAINNSPENDRRSGSNNGSGGNESAETDKEPVGENAPPETDKKPVETDKQPGNEKAPPESDNAPDAGNNPGANIKEDDEKPSGGDAGNGTGDTEDTGGEESDSGSGMTGSSSRGISRRNQ